MLDLSESRALAEGLPETAERINMQARLSLLLACEMSVSCSYPKLVINQSNDPPLIQVSISAGAVRLPV